MTDIKDSKQFNTNLDTVKNQRFNERDTQIITNNQPLGITNKHDNLNVLKIVLLLIILEQRQLRDITRKH